ncbi:MAG: endonuclease domain-containing protein [Phycisphaeraceae bacterium]
MTFPERLLWGRLRRKQVHGGRFRRQHPIDQYVVDFCCTQAMLVIEVDGDSHIGRREYDECRQRWLERQGYRVLRVTNDDILNQVDTVVQAIAQAVRDATCDPHPPPAPPSREGS